MSYGTDDQPDAGIGPERPRANGNRRIDVLMRPVNTGLHLAQDIMHEGFTLLSHPLPELQDLAAHAVTDARALRKLLLTPPERDSALRGELGVRQKVAWIDQVALADVKAIGGATGTTVNDVLVAAATGALRRYLAERRTPLDELRAMVPFNLRPLDQPLPRSLGNRFGLLYLDMPVGLKGPRQRLTEVHRRMDSIKHSPEGAMMRHPRRHRPDPASD